MIGKTTRLVGWIAASAMLLLLLGADAEAASVNTAIHKVTAGSYPANILLEDEDKTYVLDNNDDGYLTEDDVVRGMFTVQWIKDTGPDTNIGSGTIYNEATAVYDLLVTGTSTSAGTGEPPVPVGWTRFYFGPDPLFLAGAAWPAPAYGPAYSGDPTGLAAFAGTAMIVAFDDSAQDVLLDDKSTPPTGGAPWAGQEENLIGTATDQVFNGTGLPNTASGTAALWGVFGMLGNPGEIWYTDSPTTSIAALSGALAKIAGAFSAYGHFDLSLIPSGGLGDSIVVPRPTTGLEMGGDMELWGKNDGTGLPAYNNFQLESDTDVRLRVVPLPPAVFGGLGLFGLGLLIRRRFF